MSGSSEDDRAGLTRVLLGSPWHAEALQAVRAAAGAGGWIGAGFVRNAVWDAAQGRAFEKPVDVDVLILDADWDAEDRLQRQLAEAAPGVPWSVRNQARMHVRHGDAPYASIADAMRRWPETATAVAVRADGTGGLWIIAPFGLADLMRGVLRPTEDSARCRKAFGERLRRKKWLTRWPALTLAEPDAGYVYEVV